MAEHRAKISWNRTSADFSYEAYTRDHTWTFAKDLRLPASAAPEFRGNAGRLDPEAAFVASLSSCHMLTFLAIASRKGHIVDLYEDDAIGYLEKNEAGRLVMTRVILRPRVMFSGDSHPSAAQVEAMHDQSHRECFIANSVKTDVSCRPILGPEATSMGSYDT